MNSTIFYNRFAPFYAPIDWALEKHKKWLITEVNKTTPKSVLEIGIGFGSHLKHYKSADVVGIDQSFKMIESAKKLNTDKNIRLLHLSSSQVLSLDQKFETIVLSHVLSTNSKPNQLIEQALSVLSPGGKLIILNHFSKNKALSFLEKCFQPIATLFSFQSYFPIENLKALNDLNQLKAIKFGALKSYQLLVFEKPSI